jgi:hypothetical protein
MIIENHSNMSPGVPSYRMACYIKLKLLAMYQYAPKVRIVNKPNILTNKLWLETGNKSMSLYTYIYIYIYIYTHTHTQASIVLEVGVLIYN